MEIQETEVLESLIENQEELIQVSSQDLQNMIRLLRRTQSDFLEALALTDFEEKLTQSNPSIINFEDTEMSFKEYTTFDDIAKKFGATLEEEDLLSQMNSIQATEHLQKSLEIGFELGFQSEKERSERLISQILQEVAQKYKGVFTLHSGKNLKAEEFKSLRGELDFCFTKNKITSQIYAPTCLSIESKSETIQQGMKQVLAQMFGAMYYNQEQENEIPVIWGAVTNGEIWKFVKLEKLPEDHNKDFLITFDKNTFAIAKDYETNSIRGTEKVLGILEHLLSSF